MTIIPKIINDIFQIMKQVGANVAMINKVATLVKHLEHIPCKLHHFFIQQVVHLFALSHYETNPLTFVFLTWQFYFLHLNKVIISLFVEVCLATSLKLIRKWWNLFLSRIYMLKLHYWYFEEEVGKKFVSTYSNVFTVINDFHYKLGKLKKFNDISTFWNHVQK